MAHYNHHMSIPMKAASAFGFGVALMGDTTTKEQVLPAGSVGAPQIGISNATCAAAEEAEVIVQGVVKAIACASLGAFARVAPGSVNGALGPYVPTGGAASGDVARSYTIGQALEPAAAGQIFSVLIDPRNF